MTESEWLACGDPEVMLRHLENRNHWAGKAHYIATDRKLRLFACACLAKRHGDDWPYLQEAYDAAEVGAFNISETVELSAIEQAWSWCSLGVAALTGDPQAALLRDIFGNPFRPVKLNPCTRCDGDGKAHGSDRPFESSGPGTYSGPCPVCKGIIPYLTPTVLRIAQTIYDERAFDRMPVLADALEEAGCQDKDILMHLRGWERIETGCVDGFEELGERIKWRKSRGQHVRGCWVIDLLLGKE